MAQQGHSIDVDQHREFWLRKAATLDRIALKGAAAYVPAVAGEAVEAAISAARQLVEYDIAHNGLSRKGHELVTGEDYREYVRQEYHAWSRDQRG
ncbi:hypothetical protein [Streptomyces sp. NPDC046261]|uniref:hypothetical protein n=1 Tax=Streptomyces sp. NPDC046261 TaxID=3157200 RepID=UPI0033E0AAC5